MKVRTKSVAKDAVGAGMCDLDVLGGRQRKMCNVSPCPRVDPQPPITVPSTNAFVQLTGDDGDLAITGDESLLFTGATRLHRILHHNMSLDGERALTAPYTRITALASDATHIYVAVEVFGASPGKFALQKIRKDIMLQEEALEATATLTAAAIRIVQNDTPLYVSLNQRDHATLVAIGKPSMNIMAVANLQNHGKVHALLCNEQRGELVFGTWDGSVGILDTDSLRASLPNDEILAAALVGRSAAGRRKFVRVVETKFAYFFASDEPSGGGVTKFTKASLSLQRSGALASVVFSHGDLQAEGDKCTSLVADWIRLYCGTNTGKLEVLSSQTLERTLNTTNMAPVDPGSSATPSFYASMALGSHLYLVRYGGPSAVYKLRGFMAQQDCVLSPWPPWQNVSSQCFDLSQVSNRREVTCGPGYRVRQRRITKHPLWGGAACGELEDVQPCVAKDAAGNALECCTGGKVRTTQKQNVVCSAGHAGVLGTPTNTTSGCYCPAANPFEVTGVGASASMCASIDKKCGDISNATVCKHISCVSEARAAGDTNLRIRVYHTNVHQEFHWGEPHNNHMKRERKNLHKCSRSPGRMGGCVCMCWHEQNAIPQYYEWVTPKPFSRLVPPPPAPSPPPQPPSPPTGWFR